MSFMDFLFGKGEKTEQFKRFTPQQEQLQNQLLEGLSGQLPDAFSYLQRILSNDPDAVKAFEAPTRRAFEEQTLPSIAERFSGMGAQRSSAFGQQLGKAGEQLEEGLAAQRSGMQSQALAQLQSLLGGGMTPSFENVLRPGTKGLVGGLGESLSSLLPLLYLLR